MRVLPCGPDALLLEFADGAEVARYAAGLARAPIPGVVETVPAARTLLLRVPDPRALSRVATQAREVEPAEPVAEAERHVEIPVRYDGEDLGAVAAHLGLDAAEVVARHTGATWTVAFCGFSPGFAYLTSDDVDWTIPRRDSPRTRVPAGSIALAGPYTGCYPTASPGGWQLLGRTDAPLWDVAADPPALCSPGTRVRFVDAAREGGR